MRLLSRKKDAVDGQVRPEAALTAEQTLETKRGGTGYRSLFAYMGPALITSMAYMDPGNFGTDIGAGAAFNYGLLWAVWMANLMAMLLQSIRIDNRLRIPL